MRAVSELQSSTMGHLFGPARAAGCPGSVLRNSRLALDSLQRPPAPPRPPRLARPCATAAAGKGQPPTSTNEFRSLFEAQFGVARWPALLAALTQPTRHVALPNAFIRRQLASGELVGAMGPAAALQRHAAVAPLLWQPTDGGGGYPPPPRDAATGLSCWYWLDLASLEAPAAGCADMQARELPHEARFPRGVDPGA